MPDILPLETILPTILEGTSASVTFEATGLLETDVLIAVRIISTDFPDSILVEGDTFSGVFSNLFRLPPGSLKFRQDLEYGEVDSFADLPPKGTAQLYSYTAPSVMIKNFNVKVELVYTDATAVELNITKDYIQPIQGNWDTFRQQFINYVR